MDRRDSLAPRLAHECPEMPEAFPDNDREAETPDQLFYPTEPCRIILHRDNRWYLIVQEELVVPIGHCPFCGRGLETSARKPLPPPPAIEMEDFDDEDDIPAIEIEAD